jgi:hypothetical protein
MDDSYQDDFDDGWGNQFNKKETENKVRKDAY